MLAKGHSATSGMFFLPLYHLDKKTLYPPKIQPYVLQDTTIKHFTPSSDALSHSLSQGARHNAEATHEAYSHDAIRLTREALTTGREACTAERLSDTRRCNTAMHLPVNK